MHVFFHEFRKVHYLIPSFRIQHNDMVLKCLRPFRIQHNDMVLKCLRPDLQNRGENKNGIFQIPRIVFEVLPKFKSKRKLLPKIRKQNR
jgi:hypothetical protein